MKRRTTCCLLGSLLVLLVLGTFLPVTRNEFINFDDTVYVTENSHVQQGLTWANVRWALTTSAAANWHPLTWLSHMLDWEVFGPKPWGHHLTSVMFHAANTLLLFLLLRGMTGSVWRSFFVAALFGLHPLRVESVAWVAERKDVLSGFFFMLTLWAYARYARQSTAVSPNSKFQIPKSATQPPAVEAASPERVHDIAQGGDAPGAPEPGIENQKSKIKNPPALSYCLVLLFFTLGLLSKPMLVTAPFVLLLLDYWPLWRWEGIAKSGVPVAGWPRLIAEKIPLVLLAAVVSVVTFLAQRHGGTVWSVEWLPVSDRLENALVAYVRYAIKIFWPARLAVFYPHPGSWPASSVLLAALLLLAITSLVWLGRRRAPYLPVGWFWFLGTLVPVIGVVQVGWQSLADRYTYIPCISVFIIVVWGAEALAMTIAGAGSPAAPTAGPGNNPVQPAKPGWTRLVPGLLGAAFLLLCTALTRQEIGYWKDSETLFRRALAVTKYNFVAHYDLGIALISQGRLDEAMTELQEAHRLRPKAANACNAMGEILARQGRLEEAMDQFHEAIDLQPDSALARNNLGIQLSRKGALDQAIAEFQEAIKTRPDYAKAYGNLGMALQAQGHLDQAIEQLRQAVRLAPRDPDARNNLGMVLGRSGRVDEAIQQLEEAVRLDPAKPQAHHNLGLALSRRDRPAEALRQFELALDLKPDSPETHANLAAVLVQLGRKQEAIQHLTKALQLRPDYPQAQQQLRALTSDPGNR
ncbi:MAG TPA: tetratricopeptide repeat protein [Candidatus Acidoferrum sp.]|jgi:Tfp pilus assembly protein PilF|nr:tetratricopeptide repeat protein [Candidatus Acidoferrum sp.]